MSVFDPRRAESPCYHCLYGHGSEAKLVILVYVAIAFFAFVVLGLVARLFGFSVIKLMAEGGQITVETVQAAVADSARFDVFGLTDVCRQAFGRQASRLRQLDIGRVPAVAVQVPKILNRPINARTVVPTLAGRC